MTREEYNKALLDLIDNFNFMKLKEIEEPDPELELLRLHRKYLDLQSNFDRLVERHNKIPKWIRRLF